MRYFTITIGPEPDTLNYFKSSLHNDRRRQKGCFKTTFHHKSITPTCKCLESIKWIILKQQTYYKIFIIQPERVR